MKILFISEALLPSKHANSISIINMCYGMALLGHDVTLLGIRGNGGQDLWEFYSIKEIPNFHISFAMNHNNKRLQKIIILKQAVLLMKHVDLVYTRWNYAMRLSNILRKNTIVEFHYLSPYPRKRKIDKKVIQSKYTRRVVCITKKVEEDFEKLGGHQEKFMIEPGAAQIDNDYNQKRDLIMECGYIGSFYEGKGIEIVLQLAARIPQMKFHIVGGTQEQWDLLSEKYEIGENVIWYGYQPHNKTMEILETFDIALLPNQRQVVVGGADIGQYTSPNKMFEYLSKGKIIIASKLDVLQEVLENNKNAILVEPDDITEWASAIYAIINDREKQEEISKNGYECILNRYNWKARAERVLNGMTFYEK